MRRFDRVGIRIRGVLFFLSAIFLVAFSASAIALNLSVVNYQLISKTQIAASTNNGNDNYEYIYRADLANTGVSVYDASATVSSTLPEINVMQGKLTFDLVLAGKAIPSSNTFTIHAKNSFDSRLTTNGNNPAILVWNIVAKTDTVPPVISGQTPKDSFVASAKPTISAQYSDAGSGIDVATTRLLLDGTDITSGATVTASGILYQPASSLTEGSHTLQLSVSDRIGNTTNSTWSFHVDTIPPVLNGQTPIDGSYALTPTPTLSAQYQDAGSGMDIARTLLTLDGMNVTASATLTASGLTYRPTTALLAGIHRIVLTAYDLAGNSAQSSWSFSVDTTPPVIGTRQPPDNAYVSSTSPMINIQYLDAESGVDTANVHLLLDGVDVSATATISATVLTYRSASLAEGLHQLALKVYDRAGNLAQAAWQFTVDTTPPTITAPTPAEGATLANSAPAISAQYQDAISGIDVGKVALTVDGNPVTSNALVSTTGIRYQPAATLAQGTHAIALTVVDRAGNSSQTAWSFLIDSRPVTAAITPAATPAGVAANALVTALIGDPSVIASSVILQQLDAQGRAVEIGRLHDDGLQGDAIANDQTYTLRFSIYQQNPGDLTYRLAAGIQGQPTPVYSSLLPFTVSGSVGTGITLTQPVDLSFVNTSPIIVAGNVSDPAASVTINGIPANISGNSFQASVPLQEGINPLTAVAANSNGTSTTASVQVTLDTTPPKVTVISPNPGYNTTEPAITITGIVNDIVVGTVNDQQARVTVNGVSAQVTNRTYTAPDIPLQLGANILRIVAMDRTGNSATVSVTVTRTQASGTFIKMLSGNNQTGAISTPLAAPLAVQIFNGVTPVANAPVIFKVTQNNGSLQPGAPQSSLIIVNTDASGQARANFTLGNRAGAGNNLVEAYSTAASGIIPFTASGAPKQAALISVDSGNNQFGAVSQKLVLPLVAVVTDTGYNRLGGIPVTFMSKQGFGTFNGASSWETVSDSDGRALATLTLGTQPGQDNNVVEAYVSASLASGNLGLPALGFPAAFTATARVPGDPAATRISGVVLDNSNQPIPNVTMRLYQANLGNRNNVHTEVVTPVVTDAKGAFKITPAPVGLYKLMADGNTAVSAGKLYPTLEYDIVTVAGQDNTVGMPLYLPALDPLAKVCVNETTGGTLTITSSPGFSLTIQPGAATFPGGAKTGCVTVTPVNFDKMPMSPGFGQQPRYIVTIQPVGTTFNPPAAITIPNMDGLAPRAKTEMYSYDHDLAAFVTIGSATVSNDGSVIASDPGIGVMKAGWHCGGNPNTTGSVGTCPTCKKCSGSQCAADDSQTPPQNLPTDCRQEICLGGSIGSVPKDAEVPTNFCKKCQGGFTVNDPAKQKVSIAALGVTPELCTSPEQNKSLPYNLDGCTWSPDDLASWNSKMLFSTNYHLYVTNPIWGTVLGDISQSVADAQTLPCNVHDVCYQTCGSNKSSCDSGLGAGITASCDIGYPLPCNRVDQTECAGYEEEYRSCKTIGPFYQGVVESSVGSVAYQVDQAKYCYCCKAQ